MERLVLAVLVTWRVTAFLANKEPGPGKVFDKVRAGFNALYRDNPTNPVWQLIHQALGCFLCCSVWVGWGVALLSGDKWRAPLSGLGYSAAAIALQRWMKTLYTDSNGH